MANGKDSSGGAKKELYMMREFRLDVAWYKERNPEAVLAIQSGRFQTYQEHFDEMAQDRLCSPSPYFCARYYAQQSKYLQRQPAWGIIEDYFRYGAAKGLSPHWLFDEKYFLDRVPEVRQVVDAGNLVSGYQYYIRKVGNDAFLHSPSPFFNKNFYLQQLGRKPVRDLFFDFITYGNAVGVACTPLFDLEWYASRYADIKEAIGPSSEFESYFQHYMERGMRDGRIPFPDFDIDYYVRNNKDVKDISDTGKQGAANALVHFIYHGIGEGRNPNRFFDTKYYLEHNPQVVDEIKRFAYLGAFEHFLAIGIKRNLKACAPLISMSISEDAAKSLYEKRCQIQTAAVKAGYHIVIPEFQEPRLSIIIPVIDHFDFTVGLLKQLELFIKSSQEALAEVIIVDNGSSDLTVEIEKYVSGVKLIRFDQPLGYPAACNAGVHAAKGKILVFLNNDIEILPGSFERVLEVFDTAQGVGAVGGKIIKLNCEVQEAGGIVWSDGSAWGYGRGDNPLSLRFQFQRDVDYCSGCFLAVESALFRSLEGFDEQFTPGYYEETDLCARIWEAGRRVVYDPGIGVFHYEYASYSKGRPSTISTALMARNRVKFVKKNHRFLSKQHRPSATNAEIASDRSKSKMPKVLLIEDFMPRKELGSGLCRSEDIVREFVEHGWWVKIWVYKKLPEIEPIDLPFCEIIYSEDDALKGFAPFLLKSPKNIDLIWLCRTHNLPGYADAISKWRIENPNGKVILDTEALASVRRWLTNELANGGSPDLSCLEESIPVSQLEKELKGHAAIIDNFVAVNRLDQRLINRIACAPIHLLGHKIAIRPMAAKFEQRDGLLFCGAVHSEESPNYDSLVWFANKVFPFIRKRLPDIKVKIIGYWNPKIKVPALLRSEGFDFIGPVKDLSLYFEQARLFIAPTRVAAGIPHKVHEAMGLGLPAVVTPILATQLAEFDSEGDTTCFVARDFSPGSFADAVVSAYTNPELWEKIRATALQSLSIHSSPGRFRADFEGILKTIMGGVYE
ncbi:glycosyltransferase [Methylomagnum ishizawai]|uniref:glycosyltransferase n=1 Tax=Methylomagnum ishizawai TaxID=1760988 RepID=UPI001C32C6A1|nr:glycosyltransferase [Methylomagnum ishizawai]BBL76105.1 hypothetical protein MishRS11D_32030 [Methylomagnum ishizawai]